MYALIWKYMVKTSRHHHNKLYAAHAHCIIQSETQTETKKQPIHLTQISIILMPDDDWTIFTRNDNVSPVLTSVVYFERILIWNENQVEFFIWRRRKWHFLEMVSSDTKQLRWELPANRLFVAVDSLLIASESVDTHFEYVEHEEQIEDFLAIGVRLLTMLCRNRQVLRVYEITRIECAAVMASNKL